jgi:uncharacterized protein (TIGR03437 family)
MEIQRTRLRLFLFGLALAGPTALYAQAPAISSGGVVGSGLSQPPVITPSPLSIVSIFGSNFAPAGTARIVGASDFVNGLVPTNLANTCVTFNGTRAPIFAVFPGQINVQVPLLNSHNASIQVTSGCGTAQQSVSNIVTVGLASASPEFFYFSAATSTSIAATNQSGTFVGSQGLVAGVNFVSLNPGDVAVLYATGLGATKTALAAGQLDSGLNPLAGPASLSIGGVPVQAADLLYIGAAPGYAGLYQINVQVGSYLPAGEQPVLLTVSGITAPLGTLPLAGPPASTCDLPGIDLLVATPDQLTAAGTVTVNYETAGATTVSMSPIGGANLALTGRVSATVSSATTVTLSAQNSCGTVTQSIPIAIGQPGISAVVNSASPTLGASAQPGQLLALTTVNLAHPELVTRVAFSNSSGPAYYEDVVGRDAAGNLLVHASLIADTNAQGYDTGAYTVAYVWNNRLTPSTPVTLTPLSYSGDAVSDFASIVDQYYNAAVQTNALWANDQNFGSAAPAMLQIINTLYNSIGQWVGTLRTSSTAAVPIDPYAGPSAGTQTVSVNDLAKVMAYNANLVASQRATGVTTSSATSGALAPHDAFGCIYNSIRTTNPALAYCLGVEKVGSGLAKGLTDVREYIKWFPFSTLSAPLFGAEVAAAATVAGTTIALAEASEAFCDLSPVFLRPSNPFSTNPNMIPVGSTTYGNVNVGFVSKNTNSQQVTEFLAEQATDKVIEILAGEVGEKISASLLKEYFVKAFSSTLAKALNALNFKYPPTSKPLAVGNCDIVLELRGNKTKADPQAGDHLSISPSTQPQWAWHGDKAGTQLVYITPREGHFLFLESPPPPPRYQTTILVIGKKALAVGGPNTQVCASFTPTGSGPLLAGGCAPSVGGFVSSASPFLESNVLGPVTGQFSVQQVDDSTWQISATANNVYGGYSSDMSYFWEGNGFVGLSASLINTTASDGSQAINIKANQSLPDCVSSVFVQNVSGPPPANNKILTAGGPLSGSLNLPGATGAVLTFGLGTFDGSTSPTDPYYTQACTLNVTVQMAGPDETGTAAARPGH